MSTAAIQVNGKLFETYEINSELDWKANVKLAVQLVLNYFQIEEKMNYEHIKTIDVENKLINVIVRSRQTKHI